MEMEDLKKLQLVLLVHVYFSKAERFNLFFFWKLVQKPVQSLISTYSRLMEIFEGWETKKEGSPAHFRNRKPSYS